MIRLKEYLQPQPEPAPVGDYWVLSGDGGYFFVSPVTARRLERELARRWGRRWLIFYDLSGSYTRVLRRHVDCIYECTTEQRALDRAFNRAKKREAKADRAWDEDDD